MDVGKATQADAGDAAPDVVLHLKRIEGQVRGLQRMVEEKRQCGDVLTQLLAVRSSLDQVALQVFNEQIDHCLTPEGAVSAETKHRLQESLKLWSKLV